MSKKCNYVALMKCSDIDPLFSFYAVWYILPEEKNDIKFYKVKDIVEKIGFDTVKHLQCDHITYLIPANLVELHPVQK